MTARPTCHVCDRPGDFWGYDRPADRWEPYCERHLRTRHPSLEISAWLESGYARPIEIDPTPPDDPDLPRTDHFREMVEEAMDWTGS